MAWLRSRVVATLLLLFVPLVWLNQSIGGEPWNELRDRTFEAPRDHLFDYVRYPFIFLYRRSGDEELYHATASAILGAPYDVSVFEARGDSPLPPVTTPADGRVHVPYAEVPLEYPPPNVLFVLLPRLVAEDVTRYSQLFCAMMGALLILAAIVTARLGARGDRDAETWRLFVFSGLLLAHGAIAIQRLDAVVAALIALLLFAASRRRDVLLGLAGGLLFAVKIVPVVLLPLVMLAGGVRGRARFARISGGAAIGAVLGLGPMLLLSPTALSMVLAYHRERGLHVESCLGALYAASQWALGKAEPAQINFGSYNLAGRVPDALATASMPITLALVALVAFTVFSPRTGEDGAPSTTTDDVDERVALVVLAGLFALWLGGKVFSPQYLTWGIPVVLALPGRRGLLVSAAFGVILAISQLYLRGFYDHVYDLRTAGVLTLLVRLALLVFGFVLLLRRLRAPRSAAHEAPIAAVESR